MLGCPDWASVGAEVFVAEEVVLLGHPGLEQQVAAAGWWVLQDDLAGWEASVAVAHLVTAVLGGAASAAVVVHQTFSGLSCLQRLFAVVLQTVASELEGIPPGFVEESPDLVAVVEL